jgi:hypothetical protein
VGQQEPPSSKSPLFLTGIRKLGFRIEAGARCENGLDRICASSEAASTAIAGRN